MTDAERIALTSASPDELADKIVEDIEAYAEARGSDLEAAHLDLVDEDRYGEIAELWAEARKARAQVEAEAPPIAPAQVAPAPELEEDFAADEFEDFAPPEAEPEPAPEAAPDSATALVRFANETPKLGNIPALLSHAAPYDTAKEYARRYCWREDMFAACYWQGEFWEWNGRHYEALPLEVVKDRVYAFLDTSQKRTMSGEERFRPTPKNVSDVIDCLKAGLTPRRKDWQPPLWIDTGEDATNVLVFRNGIVNILTGERTALTPRLWVHSAVDYDYDPEAKCPHWECFLEEVFPGDKASQDFIEEWLGYGMTEETKFEKAAMWIGKKRSGKGTIAHVQKTLIGAGAFVGLNFNTWLKGENSASCMIGKRAGVFPDIRFKPGKAFGISYDAGGITYPSIEMLLNVTAADHVTLGRKYLGPWEGILRLKLTLISNNVLNFNDANLVSRFIKINFAQSFFNREDVDLRKKLEDEISGIAARCLAAYRRLVARGRFVQPQSGLELEQKVIAESDPFAAFINDLFVIDQQGTVNCATVKMRFDDWCRNGGRFDVLRSATTASLLTQRLKGVAGLEGLSIYRPHAAARQYVGLRLRTKEERDV